jgi:hypothetical protein
MNGALPTFLVCFILWYLTKHRWNINFTLRKIRILTDSQYTVSSTYAVRFDSTSNVIISIT